MQTLISVTLIIMLPKDFKRLKMLLMDAVDDDSISCFN